MLLSACIVYKQLAWHQYFSATFWIGWEWFNGVLLSACIVYKQLAWHQYLSATFWIGWEWFNGILLLLNMWLSVEAVDTVEKIPLSLTVEKIPLSLSTKLPFGGNGYINASVNFYLSGNK